MMNKNDILKMARHISHRGKGFQDRRILHADREWATGVFIFLLIALIGSFFTARLYVHYNSIETLASLDPEKVDTQKLNHIEEASRIYTEREKKFEEIASRSPQIRLSTTTEPVTSTPGISDEEGGEQIDEEIPTGSLNFE